MLYCTNRFHLKFCAEGWLNDANPPGRRSRVVLIADNDSKFSVAVANVISYNFDGPGTSFYAAIQDSFASCRAATSNTYNADFILIPPVPPSTGSDLQLRCHGSRLSYHSFGDITDHGFVWCVEAHAEPIWIRVIVGSSSKTLTGNTVACGFKRHSNRARNIETVLRLELCLINRACADFQLASDRVATLPAILVALEQQQVVCHNYVHRSLVSIQ
mmetsp:Transcript_42472/g.83349  ORF Transcript_42472/g.83349 Transcript_42472/m.83349 type:complete len:216 (-) Transcript_42472:11190-11837(-)